MSVDRVFVHAISYRGSACTDSHIELNYDEKSDCDSWTC